MSPAFRRVFQLTAHPAHGQRRVRYRVILGTLCALVVLGLLASPAAYAYGPVGGFDGGGQFNSGVAVDQVTGDVYVANFFSGVEKFSSSGTDLGAVGSCPYCRGVAVDPVNEDLYAYDAGNLVIDTFDSSGNLLGSFPVAGPQYAPVQIATDSAGNVYFPNQSTNTVQEFSPSGTLLNTFSGGSVGAFSAPQGVAVDSNGNVYVDDAGNGRVVEIAGSGDLPDPSGAQSVLDSGGSQDVAVDPVTDDVFVLDLNSADACGAMSSPCSHVLAYHSDGTQFTDFGAGTIQNSGGNANHLAVNGSTDDVYVSDFGNQVWIFSPVPTVTSDQATGVGATSATLNGTVNPSGLQLSDCRFDYVDAADYDPSASDPYSAGQTAPCVPSASSIAPDSNDHAVTAALTGLVQGTTYHVRLEATNSDGTGYGLDETFTTPDAPSIDGAYTQNLTTTSVDLVAQINPSGADTTYHFEYGTGTSYGTNIPVPDADIGSGSSDVTVTQHLSGLTPDTTYHWRVVAVNSVNTTTGEDHTFSYSTATGLPDNRGYEVVSSGQDDNDVIASPLVTNQHSGIGDFGLVSPGGDSVVWDNAFAGPFPYSSNGYADVIEATRGSAGWTQSTLAPPGVDGNYAFELDAASGDLSTVLVEEFPTGITNVSGQVTLLEHLPDGSFATVATGLPSGVVARLSPDGSHVLFQTSAQLAGDTHGAGNQLYEWTQAGGLRVAAVDSAGNPTSSCGGAVLAGGGGLAYPDISTDGSTFFFQSPDPNTSGSCGPSELYVRQNDSTTIEISKPPTGATDYGAMFVGASADGSKVFFSTQTELTPDKTDTDPDLYEYDVDTGALTRLSVGPAGYDDADLYSGGSGSAIASADGSTVYFTALGQLVPGEGTTEATNNSQGTVNLYRWHEGDGVSFIATIQPGAQSGQEGGGTAPPLSTGVAAVTPDGSDLVFSSDSQLTGYDNGGQGELYRYDQLTGTISCVTCGPTGALPDGGTRPAFHTLFSDTVGPVDEVGGLSADGSTVVFTSTDQLLPGATNFAESTSENPIFDVYEWEADGSGSCQTAGGCLDLISGGTSPSSDFLLGASQTDSDIFFVSADQLAPQDTSQVAVIYDARVGGGFPVSTPPACESADTCRAGPPAAPAVPVAGTVTFVGPGDAVSGTAPTTGKVKLLHKIFAGSSFRLTVRVPAEGRIVLSGTSVKTVRRSVGRAGAYRLMLRLTTRGKRELKRKGQLRLKFRVRYTPKDGVTSSVTVSMTVKAR